MRRLRIIFCNTAQRHKTLLKVFKYTLVVGILLFIIIIQTLEHFFVIQYKALPILIQKHLQIVDFGITSKNINSTFSSVGDPSNKRPRVSCRCLNTSIDSKKNSSHAFTSTCNIEAMDRGIKQNVISYSLFLSSSDQYGIETFLNGLPLIIQKNNEIYPDWLIYIYTNLLVNNYSCNLICKYDNLHWCDIHNIPLWGDLSSVNGRIWRFIPIGDPNVDNFMVRDLDSLPSWREKTAVDEWIKSTKTFHIMRDSQWHDTEILAGLWGAKNNLLSSKVKANLIQKFIQDGKTNQDKGLDQELLRKHIFYKYTNDILAHDSYFCEKYNESITLPFPTKRIGEMFVGHDHFKELDRLFVGRIHICPERCRPNYGKSWWYC